MWPFKRKNKYKDWFENYEDKSKKKKRRILNLVTFCVIALALLINSIFYFKDNDIFGYTNQLSSLTPYEIAESDLNLVWSKNNANVDVMKSKCAACGLDKVANDINAVNIQAEENSPTKTLHLNYDEVAYFANVVLSFNGQFTLLDFVWEINDNIATVTTHFAYDIDIVHTTFTKYYMEDVYEYNFEDFTIKEKSAKIINVGENGSYITDHTYLLKLRIMLTQFILQAEPTAIKDITEIEDKDIDSKPENFFKENDKTLCQMLGFNSINFLAGGIDYLI